FPVFSGRRVEKLAAAGEQDARGLIRRPRGQDLLEQIRRPGEVARAVGGEAALVERSPARRLGCAFGDTEQFVDRQPALTAIDREPVELAHLDAVAGKAA